MATGPHDDWLQQTDDDIDFELSTNRPWWARLILFWQRVDAAIAEAVHPEWRAY